MKKLLLPGIAALLLATGAHAASGVQQQEKLRDATPKNWSFDNYKKCYASLNIKFDFTGNHENRAHPWADPLGELVHPDGARVTFTRNHIRELEAAIHFLKKCQRCYYNWRVGDYCATLKDSIKMDKEDLPKCGDPAKEVECE